MRLKTARNLLRAVIIRASGDPDYMYQLRADPVYVLVEAGLPYDVIEDFLRETGAQGEVSGFSIPECATTCALTNSSDYPAALNFQ
jgi:hypothetical protein